MKINTLSINQPTYKPTKLQNSNIATVTRSAFNHIDTVSFGNNDLLTKSPNEISEILAKSITPKNFLGEGGEAKVYRIPDTEYCIRLIKEDIGNNKIFRKISKDLTEQDKINHNVAKIGKHGSSIMRYIEGSPVISLKITKQEQASIANNIANLPVSSFNKLLKQIAHANDNNMVFDCSAFNIIVNPKTQTMTAIDFYKTKIPEYFAPLNFIDSALINTATTMENKKSNAGKILLAALQEFEPNKKPCVSPSQFDFSRYLYKLFDREIIENKNFITVCVSTFDKLTNEKYKEIRGENNSLRKELNTAKVLIKQLLHVT